jgi:DNA-binding NarL/FixJ family response regulator
VRVVIAEDLALLREGLVGLLTEARYEVVAAVGDAPALMRAVSEHAPQLAVIDVRMPPSQRDEGLRAAIAIRRSHPEVAILILSQYVEERYATELLSGGSQGVGYLLKDRVADVSEFLAAARRVAAGGTAIDPEVIEQLLSRRQREDLLDELTPREREVLGLMAEGHTNAGIAERLVVTDGAIEKHVRSIFQKLGLPATDAHNRRVLAVLTYLGV